MCGLLTSTIALTTLCLGASADAPSKIRTIILDTDIGGDVDDAITLVLAAKSPEIRLAGVVVNGSGIERRVKLAQEYLRLADRDDVPVAGGAATPLIPKAPDRSDADNEGSAHSPMAAIGLMHDIVSKSSDNVTIVSVGAATNTALFLTLYPGLAGRIEEILIMGGAFRAIMVGGAQLPPTIETNLNRDPVAAEIVLRSGVPVRLVPAELTFNAVLSKDAAGRIRSKHTPLTNLLSDEIDAFSTAISHYLIHFGAAEDSIADMSVLLHDPLALTALLRPELVQFSPLRFDLLRGKNDELHFAVDPLSGAFRAAVATSTDYAALESFVVERITDASRAKVR